jgi:hypothetical protein
LVELTYGRRGQRAGLVVDHDRLFLEALEVLAGGQDLVRRQLLGAIHVSLGEGIGFADVEHQRALVHEPDQVLRRNRRDARSADARFVDEQHHYRKHRGRRQVGVMSDVFDQAFHVHVARGVQKGSAL